MPGCLASLYLVPVIWDTLADFLGRAGGGGEDLGPTGGGGGRGRPAIGLFAWLADEGFLPSVPVLEAAGLGSPLLSPAFDLLELLGGATGPQPGISTLGEL